MERELNFWVAGGDLRQAQLARLLAADGHTVHTWALEEAPLPGLDHQRGPEGIERADCVVLPLPVSAGAGLLNAPPVRPGAPPGAAAGPALPRTGAVRGPGGPGLRRPGRGSGG